MSNQEVDPADSPVEGRMPPTLWTVVLKAAENDSPEATEALGRLFQRYRLPLLGYVRQRLWERRRNPDQAEDHVQSFFQHLISSDGLAKVRRERGRFRSFLLVSLRNHLSDRISAENAEKRGAGRDPLPLDPQPAEGSEGVDPAGGRTPDQEFDRAWAVGLLSIAMARLEAECAKPEDRRNFEVLHPYLADPRPERSYSEAAARLGLSEDTTKVRVHRLRARFGLCIRQEISDTLASPTRREIEEELQALFAALSDAS
jgi:RNA polymerase sigma-70 factor (ECF subfamily)